MVGINFEEQSTTIRSISYDKGEMKLLVEFESGGTYEYNGVDGEAYSEFMSQPSVGSYFDKSKGKYDIFTGKYTVTKL